MTASISARRPAGGLEREARSIQNHFHLGMSNSGSLGNSYRVYREREAGFRSR